MSKPVSGSSSAVDYEIPLPPSEKTAALRELVTHVSLSPHDEAAGWKSDEYLNRFLIARGGDVAAAAKMFEKTMCFRRDTGISTILQTYANPRVMHTCFSGGPTGIDHEGFPVWIERIGTADASALLAAVLRASVENPDTSHPVPLDPFVRWMAWCHEEQERIVQRWCKRTGRSRGRMTFLVDLAGVSMRHLSSSMLSVLRSKAALEMSHYPEIVRRIFLLNTPQVSPC